MNRIERNGRFEGTIEKKREGGKVEAISARNSHRDIFAGRESTSIYSCTVYEIFDRNTRCGTGINSGVPSRYERGTFRVLEWWNRRPFDASVFMCARLDIYYRSYPPVIRRQKYLIFPIF